MTSQPSRTARLPRIIGALLLTVIALILLLWFTRAAWLPLPGRWLVVADPLQPAAAVVALAGGTDRITYAADLYHQGYADWYVAGDVPLHLPGLDITYRELVKREAMANGVPGDLVVALPYTVETTVEEAQALRQLAEEQDWPSLLVITDPYHTRRARRILNDIFQDSEVRLAIRPVENSWYQPEIWWQYESGIRETWTEYVKFGLYLSGYQN